MVSPPDILDCLVVGGGPAGLTAAVYLARFHLAVQVVDAGASRAALIPKTRNHAGFPDGIAGTVLVERMREQAALYGTRIVASRVETLRRDGDNFVAQTDTQTLTARSVLIATGVTNRRPDMSDAQHGEALSRGLLRYCPICDGYEVTDKRVAVLGTGERGLKEAIFLRSYTADLALIAPDGAHELGPADRARLEDGGIRIVDGPVQGYQLHDDMIGIALAGGELGFASLYPALGSDIHSDLARQVGATMGQDGCLSVDDHQRTDIPGLYAAGDVVQGLDQISHAMGEGGVAATTIRNDLADRMPLRR